MKYCLGAFVDGWKGLSFLLTYSLFVMHWIMSILFPVLWWVAMRLTKPKEKTTDNHR